MMLAAQALLLTVSLTSWLLCPFSKVEESFNLQATHDLFYYGLAPAFSHYYYGQSDEQQQGAPPDFLPYDHLQYPGVVPRTFAGPLLLSWACQLLRQLVLLFSTVIAPFRVTAGGRGDYSFDLAEHAEIVQRLARLVLLLLTASQWFALARALDGHSSSHDYHPHAGTYLLLITACQFHMTFYMSRLLPNCLATVLTLRSLTHWLRSYNNRNNRQSEQRGDKEIQRAAVYLVLAATIVRCDLVLLLFTVGLSWLFTRQLTVRRALQIGLATVVVGLAVTVPIDSLLWQRGDGSAAAIVWPEGQVLYFNTVLNKSSEWGVLAWHWYFSRGVPVAMLFT